jgi:hypothetical protein
MPLWLLLLSLAQDAQVEGEVQRLGHDDVAVREEATQKLIRRGPAIVPRVLELVRETPSPEVRLRAEGILERFPFTTFVRTDPKESLHRATRDLLLGDLKDHLHVPECWKGTGEPLAIDSRRLRILRQDGSGHGQYLALDRLFASPDGGLTLRRIAYQGTTPYRPDVKEEGVRALVSTFDPAESRALAELIGVAAALQNRCGRARDPHKHWVSSASFSMRFRIEAAGTEVWSAAYTGYASSDKEEIYSHGWILDRLMERVQAQRPWAAAEITAEDRALGLSWMTDHFQTEGWWVKERFLDLARFLGDESYLPFLGKVARELEGKNGPSELRQQAAVQDALVRIAGRKR